MRPFHLPLLRTRDPGRTARPGHLSSARLGPPADIQVCHGQAGDLSNPAASGQGPVRSAAGGPGKLPVQKRAFPPLPPPSSQAARLGSLRAMPLVSRGERRRKARSSTHSSSPARAQGQLLGTLYKNVNRKSPFTRPSPPYGFRAIPVARSGQAGLWISRIAFLTYSMPQPCRAYVVVHEKRMATDISELWRNASSTRGLFSPKTFGSCSGSLTLHPNNFEFPNRYDICGLFP